MRSLRSLLGMAHGPQAPQAPARAPVSPLGEEVCGGASATRYYVLVSRSDDHQTAALVAVLPSPNPRIRTKASAAMVTVTQRRGSGDARGYVVQGSPDVDPSVAPGLAPYAGALAWFMGLLASPDIVAQDGGQIPVGVADYDGALRTYNRTDPVTWEDVPTVVAEPVMNVYRWNAPDAFAYDWGEGAHEIRGGWIGECDLVNDVRIALGEYAADQSVPLMSGEWATSGAPQGFDIWQRTCSASPVQPSGGLPGADRLFDAAAALGVTPSEAQRATPELLCADLALPAVRQAATSVYGIAAPDMGRVRPSVSTRGGPLFGAPTTNPLLARRPTWKYNAWRQICALGASSRLAPQDVADVASYANGRRMRIDESLLASLAAQAEAEGGPTLPDWEIYADLFDIAADAGIEITPMDIVRPGRLCALLAPAMVAF